MRQTTTLAAGINTPASTVIPAEQEFIGEDRRPRHGRGVQEHGGTRRAALAIANPARRLSSPRRRSNAAASWSAMCEPRTDGLHRSATTTCVIVGHPDFILSQRHVRGRCRRAFDQAPWRLPFASKADPGWKDRTEQSIAELVAQFVERGLLERNEGKVQLTFGRRPAASPVSRSTPACDSSRRSCHTRRRDRCVQVWGLVQLLPEADKQYTPVRKKARIESVRIEQARAAFGSTVVSSAAAMGRRDRVLGPVQPRPSG